VKVRQFVNDELDDEEAEMFSVLLAPGVSLAYENDRVIGDEVVGFAAPSGPAEWQPGTLAAPLSGALRDAGVRVVATTG